MHMIGNVPVRAAMSTLCSAWAKGDTMRYPNMDKMQAGFHPVKPVHLVSLALDFVALLVSRINIFDDTTVTIPPR
jgi:hypothetical protein